MNKSNPVTCAYVANTTLCHWLKKNLQFKECTNGNEMAEYPHKTFTIVINEHTTYVNKWI